MLLIVKLNYLKKYIQKFNIHPKNWFCATLKLNLLRHYYNNVLIN